MPLSNDRNTPYRETQTVVIRVAAGAKIFGGALVAVNAAGFAVPGSVSATLTYVGRAECKADNTGGADGAKSVEVRRDKAFKWINSGADPIGQADLFKTCYIVDDQTVAKTNAASTRSVAGRIVGLDVDGVWVE